MNRISLNDLIKAFEQRIIALEKNPKDIVSDDTIHKMLEMAVNDEIRYYLKMQVRKELKKLLINQFKAKKDKMVKRMLNDMLSDSIFRNRLSVVFKEKIIKNLYD